MEAEEIPSSLASGKEDLGYSELSGEGVEATRDRLQMGGEESRVVQPLRSEMQRVDVLKVLQTIFKSK